MKEKLILAVLFGLFIGGIFLIMVQSAVPPEVKTSSILDWGGIEKLNERVHILEGQVKELRRVVGLEGGLPEGLQRQGVPKK